jgi:selenocysteine lyase/cysteine desulfurase
LGKAITLLQRIGMDIIEEREKVLVRRLLQGLSGVRGIEIFGIKNPDSKRLHHKGGIFSFRLNRVPHNLVANELAEHGGIGVRNGCFCAHLLVKHLLRIHPARAFGANISLKLTPHLTSIILPGLVRVSLGLENDENDIKKLISVLEKIAVTPRSLINRLLAFTGNGTPFLSHTSANEQIKEFLEARIKKVYPPCSN